MTAPADATLHNMRRHSGKIPGVTHDHPSLKDYHFPHFRLDIV
jgi:hypothetical protein